MGQFYRSRAKLGIGMNSKVCWPLVTDGPIDSFKGMDILAILEDHLGFIKRFYSAAAEPFETTLRKINAGESPFDPKGAPEDYDGPEYEIEWIEANKCLGVLGNCSLGLLEKALHDYLREFVQREGGSSRCKTVFFTRCSGQGQLAGNADQSITATDLANTARDATMKGG